MASQSKIKKLEADLWESADLLRSSANLNANQYCMPVLGLLFLKYAHSRFKRAEAEILKNRPTRAGRVMPVEPADFKAKSAIFLPREARYDFLLSLPADPSTAGVKNAEGETLNSLGDIVNNAMRLIEENTTQLNNILPRTYNIFSNDVLNGLLRIFNNDLLDEVGGDVIGRIYEYFLGKFSKTIADGDGVFFTPKSLVQLIINIIEPKHGVVLDPACGSGGMFVQSGDFVNASGMNANSALTFYGQEKVDYNAKLCLMNMAVHGLNAQIKSGDGANTFAHDAHNLEGSCDYVMANPPFNVKKVKKEMAEASGRIPFGLPGYNKKSGEIGNANYLWIQYFYAYLNERGRAGFVMASSATDSQNRDRDIREELVKTGHVDVIVSVANNFFYTLSLPCTLWFFDKGKKDELRDKVLFIDARNYYTVVDRNLNEWTEWQIRNLNAIVWLYRGETERYKELIASYQMFISDFRHISSWSEIPECRDFPDYLAEGEKLVERLKSELKDSETALKATKKREEKAEIKEEIETLNDKISWSEHYCSVVREAVWLTDKFGMEGEYADVAGLCRIATIDDIEKKNYSLTPGAYVGVAQAEDDGIDFATRMKEIHSELADLNSEANTLWATIQENLSMLWK